MPRPESLLRGNACLPLGLWLWLFWVCAYDWRTDDNFAHAWLLPPLAFFFFYRRLDKRGPPPVSRPLVLPLLLSGAAAVAVLPLEVARLTPVTWRLLPWLIYGLAVIATFSWAWQNGGGVALRAVIFPVLLLALTVPWPSSLEEAFSTPLAALVASITGEILPMLGVECRVHGRIIEVAQGMLGVDEACSGLRSFHASLAAGLVLGEWRRLAVGRRLLLVFFSVLMAMAINILRTSVLAFAVEWRGIGVLDTWHDPLGAASMVGLVLAIAAVARLLQVEGGASLSQEPFPRLTAFLFPAGSWRGAGGGLFFLAFAAFGLAHLWYWPGEGPHSSASALVGVESWNPGTLETPVQESTRARLKADSASYRRLHGTASSEALAYHLYWNPGRNNGMAFFHRPEACMPGNGWSQEGPPLPVKSFLFGKPVTFQRFRFYNRNSRVTLYWISWIDGEPVTQEQLGRSILQLNFIPRFIRTRKTRMAVEMLAFVDLRPEGEAPEEELRRLIVRFLDTQATTLSPHRGGTD